LECTVSIVPPGHQNSLLRVPAALREDLGFGETARSRLKFGSARRAAPTHFFRFAVLHRLSGIRHPLSDFFQNPPEIFGGPLAGDIWLVEPAVV
jgi:hypothetical protein